MTKQHFDETYGANAPENYERFFVPAIGKPLAEDLVRCAGLLPEEKVLDVACGTGIVTRLALREISPDGSVAGLDVNPGMLAVARSSVPEDAPISWYEASAEAIPLPDDTFDVVLCQMGLQFMEDKLVALKEMRRVLAPGGRLLFNVPGPIAEIFDLFAGALGQHIGSSAEGFIQRVFSLHKRKEIEQLLSIAGFAGIDIQAESQTLTLPAPKDFLWQYVYSTPLTTIINEIDQNTRDTLENEIVGGWQNFSANGSMKYRQRIVTACARK